MLLAGLQDYAFPEITDGVLELSDSSVKLGSSCARKLEFRKFHESSRRQEGLAMGVGQALHAGTQGFLTHGDFDRALWEMMEQYPIQWQKSAMDQNSIEAAYATLRRACGFTKLGEFELAKIEGPDGELMPAVEVPFVLRLSDFPWYADGRTITIDYIGFIDLIMYDRFNDEYNVWDIKTTTRTVDFNLIYRFDTQCLPYGLVLEALLDHDYRQGFNVAYWTQYIHPLEPLNYFNPYMKTLNDVQEWLRSYLFFLNQIKTYYNMGWFPRAGGNTCNAFQKPCQFVDLCEYRDPNFLNPMIAQENVNLPESTRPDPWIIIDLEIQV